MRKKAMDCEHSHFDYHTFHERIDDVVLRKGWSSQHNAESYFRCTSCYRSRADTVLPR